jgi:hypothetical protein
MNGTKLVGCAILLLRKRKLNTVILLQLDEERLHQQYNNPNLSLMGEAQLCLLTGQFAS